MIEYSELGPRIVVIGTTGSGKSTIARRLAQHYGISHIELDALHWLPGWVMTELEPFRQSVAQALSGPTWVVDGNYSKVRDLVWPRATGLVWLDYTLPVILWQLLKRSLNRAITREVLWNNNRETFRGLFFSRDSLLLWALHTYRRHRKVYAELLACPEYSHVKVIRLRSRKETARWLANLEKDDFTIH